MLEPAKLNSLLPAGMYFLEEFPFNRDFVNNVSFLTHTF